MKLGKEKIAKFFLKKWTKLNKNNEYQEQIEYRKLTLTRGMIII